MTQTKSAAAMVAEARARIQEIEAVDAIAMASDPDVVFVDVRDARERAKTGFIPGAQHVPRGMLEFWFDPSSPYHRPALSQEGKRYVLHCALGWRSALAVATLQDMGITAAHITGGFEDWLAQGGPVEHKQ